jgi:hypothetical protein
MDWGRDVSFPVLGANGGNLDADAAPPSLCDSSRVGNVLILAASALEVFSG